MTIYKKSKLKSVLPDKNQIQIEKFKKSVIINLSDRFITIYRDHLYLFHLGESFAPTPRLPDQMKFKDDVTKWINSMINTVHYGMRENTTQGYIAETEKV